ncbi:NAD(P)H-dependent glycerol-3-phosphate dehydrogenase [Oscillochloris sp. ZM17-4]|uniref:NAD(P)H-dependent glycerol-3-phosphate dehydrogenase n=1 Tax=Oscillochloris sp. ZM17-4 TaxID=2866714 RepID=UPI001C73B990|nr:NAD(P)H-dependent glycerol-3-phosphate dehydrogenase [Oscillochloris sp. ZM17-4]MBX0327195.1 NAD(P)H-dependent glycerol-3-phosphate dehydrogenase [Oscillochloris sp. ZM17-4]
MQVGIIGLGNLGTALAQLITANGHAVLGWEYNPQVVAEINAGHTNARYLPDIALSPGLTATGQLDEVLAQCATVFVTLPSAFIRSALEPHAHLLRPGATVINLAKGIDRATGQTAYQTVCALFPGNPCLMLAGPAIAGEFARGMPTLVMLAGGSSAIMLPVAGLLDNDHFRVRFSQDALGVELGGILKNIYAIGLGFFDGKQVSSANFRAAYLTMALEEMARLGVGMGARQETFFYLAGMGDLLATALSARSHNRGFGEQIAAGKQVAEIEAESGVLPEGYQTLRVVLLLAEKIHVPAPLALGIWHVLTGHATAESFIDAFVRDFISL